MMNNPIRAWPKGNLLARNWNWCANERLPGRKIWLQAGLSMGFCRIATVARRHWNEEGARRMKVGLRMFRGSLVAALVAVVTPVVVVTAVSVAVSPAAAQS